MSGFVVEPADGENYEGRQWGWVITQDGHRCYGASQGGTGPCWNVTSYQTYNVTAERDTGDPYDQIHICDLEAFIEALEALRDSPAHVANVERWE